MINYDGLIKLKQKVMIKENVLNTGISTKQYEGIC